ncbi:MAG: 4Fe-4S ferredoxin, partial [Thermodesulfovibrionales bacterium]|nr:4Fe-4S ferredoxin [Thermodesulfovibrionales bacterium]
MINECPSCSTVGVVQDNTEAGYKLSHWPIQIKLIGTVAPFLNDADLLVAADCTAFAGSEVYRSFMKDKRY